ncbi:DUF742 domain-containing protein [Prauserella oleivorans]|uniref:DUF742 domain-containing protein n=1 Tax=Prauserella oleivorans TaxID=1478153 RepID=A0ABW5W637_9PSEU
MTTGPGTPGEYPPGVIYHALGGAQADSGHGRRPDDTTRDDPGAYHGRAVPTAQLPGEDGERAAARYTTGEEKFVSAEAIPLSPAEETGFVRPYAITGGRTKANYPLELETLISTRETAVRAVPEQIEHQVIMEECRTPRSVAEIAALLRVPLGVARVLISDAADTGLVTVHRTASGSEGAEAHMMLMERVLSGLRRL